MIIKSILATATIALSATSAVAAPVLKPSVDITRGDAFAIRACSQVAYGELNSVCYNEVTSGSASLFGVPVAPISWSNERVRRVSCDARIPRTDKSTRGQVALEFCPQVEAGTLAPAPFLL